METTYAAQQRIENSGRYIVEITDEDDHVVGFAIATNGFKLEPTIYAVRSEAHAALRAVAS